jgi:hypothetical protein
MCGVFLPVAVPFSWPMMSSRGDSNKRTQSFPQPIDKIGFVPAPMMP